MIKFRESLQLEPASFDSPEPETKKMIRGLALRAKSEKRDDLVRHLREITPAGTTGEFKKMRFSFSHGEGDKVSTQASSRCIIKIMSTRAKFYCVAVFLVVAVGTPLICLIYMYFCFGFRFSKKNSAILIFF